MSLLALFVISVLFVFGVEKMGFRGVRVMHASEGVWVVIVSEGVPNGFRSLPRTSFSDAIDGRPIFLPCQPRFVDSSRSAITPPEPALDLVGTSLPYLQRTDVLALFIASTTAFHGRTSSLPRFPPRRTSHRIVFARHVTTCLSCPIQFPFLHCYLSTSSRPLALDVVQLSPFRVFPPSFYKFSFSSLIHLNCTLSSRDRRADYRSLQYNIL